LKASMVRSIEYRIGQNVEIIYKKVVQKA